MKPSKRFSKQSNDFWAHIRSISQEVGYTERGKNKVKIPTIREIKKAFEKLNLEYCHLIDENNHLTNYGKKIIIYFKYRAKILNNYVEPRLMEAELAKYVFDELKKICNPTCPLPMNKQKGEKKAPAYLTCIVNITTVRPLDQGLID